MGNSYTKLHQAAMLFGRFRQRMRHRSRPALFGAAGIVAPAFHGGTHGQDLVLKLRAGPASHQVQLERDVVRQAERAVFAGNQQRRGFPAGAS